MSLDLNRDAFIFGNLDLLDISYSRINFQKMYSYYDALNLQILKKDKSWEWRYMKNFKTLLEHYENYLLNELTEFEKLEDFLLKSIKFYEKTINKNKYSSLNPKEKEDYFGINTLVIINWFKTKLELYSKTNTSIDIKKFENKFSDYLKEENDFLYDFVSPYEDIKWTSKWKFLTKNKEITCENIDIYLDSYFKNYNIYYNSSMSANILALKERLDFLYINAPAYYNILEKKLEKVTEKIFIIFPYSIVYNNYKELKNHKIYIPSLLKDIKTRISDTKWLFSSIPEFLSAYILGFPVISMDIPHRNKILEYIEKLESMGEENYFKFIKNKYNEPYVKSISFDTSTGNLTEDDNILDLCYNNVTDFNQDDISCLFNENVVHYFTSKEFNSIIKKQENPYNRQYYPNLNKILENLKFKNRARKKLINRGLDLELEGTLLENFQELKKKISSEMIIHYFPYNENNSDNFFRPLLEILLQSL